MIDLLGENKEKYTRKSKNYLQFHHIEIILLIF